MIGKPKYNYNQKVVFTILENGKKKTKVGTVDIIDYYGTFFDKSDVSYDIMVKENGEYCLYKHIREDKVQSYSPIT